MDTMTDLLVNTNISLLGQNVSFQNTTNATFTRNEDLARVEVIVQSVIFVLAVLGNSTVLLSLFRKRKSLTRMHHLMMHLSLADLFVAFGSVLPQLAWDITYVFKGGDLLCRLVKYMQIVAIYASAYVLVMTAVDRYFAICFPFISHKWSHNMVRKMVIVAWTLSLLLSVPQLFIFSYQLNTYGMYDCWGTFQPEWTLTVYITTFTVLVYIIPAFILVFCYGSICIAVWKSGRIGERFGSRPRSNTHSSSPTRTQERRGSIELRDLRTGCLGSCTAVTGSVGSTNDLNNIQSHSGKCTEQPINISPKWNSNIHDKEEDGQTILNGGTIVKYSFINDTPRTLLCTCKANKETDHCTVANGKHSYNLTIEGASVNTNDVTKDVSRRSSRCNNSSPPHKTLLNASRGSPSRLTDRRGANHGISRAKLRTIKLTLTVVMCYLACWSPFFIAQMWAVYDPTAPFYGSAYTIILLLASLNSCTNPWIYLIFSESFIAEFKQTSRKLTRVIRCSKK